MGGLLTTLALIFIGWFFGRRTERRHLAALDAGEAALAHIPIYNLRHVPEGVATELEADAIMVTGNVVIAFDYFKRIAGAFRGFFGGEVVSYSRMMDRARREAVLRLHQEAARLGADAVYNVRVEFSTIGQMPQISGAELLAYGTAVKRKSSA